MNADKKTIAFLATVLFLIVLVSFHNFVRYHINRDYELIGYTSCDQNFNNCFISDEKLIDFAFYTKPYAKVSINAKYAPDCLNEHTCLNFSCDGIPSCVLSYCDAESTEPGEHCTDVNK